MELTIPRVATLRRDPDQAAKDAETADAALAASGDGSAFERLYRTQAGREWASVKENEIASAAMGIRVQRRKRDQFFNSAKAAAIATADGG